MLPSNWVDRIFTKLTLIYGRSFISRYEGIDLLAVKADWALELSRFSNSPESIAFALSNLPKDYPPNVLQFKDLCKSSPPKATVIKALPVCDSEKVKALIADLRNKFKATQAA